MKPDLARCVHPAMPAQNHPIAYKDKGGALVFVKVGADTTGMEPAMWHEPPPEAAAFGPYYKLHLSAETAETLLVDREFKAGVAAGEFCVTASGLVLIRPPAPRT